LKNIVCAACHAGGREFESRPDRSIKPLARKGLAAFLLYWYSKRCNLIQILYLFSHLLFFIKSNILCNFSWKLNRYHEKKGKSRGKF